MRLAILAILALSACTENHQRARAVDIDGAALEAQADIDNYAAMRKAEPSRLHRVRHSSH